jgi:predicted lysophospholipase L1 biosynthesis ABC-type transport system permease subunit
MSGESAVGNISINGAPPGDVFADFVTISPGWADLMRVPLLDGRDFRPGDVNPAVAIVNQAFAKQYFDGADPVGKWFDRVDPAAGRAHFQIVGYIGDARSRDRLRWPIRPTVYIPFSSVDTAGAPKPAARGTFVIRTASANPLALADILRRGVASARPGFRVRNTVTQAALNDSNSLRERLLAMLATFFATVALWIAAVGIYGVLNYSVIQRQREIGIRIAIGARSADIVRRVCAEGLAMVVPGAIAGLAMATLSVRYVESLLYQARLTEVPILAIPSLTIFTAALLAAVPAIIRAVRTDAVKMLRAE